jgi:hypothetical protein
VTNGNEHEISGYYGFHYTYMRDQELTRVTAQGPPALTYDLAYDALGRCVKRTINNTTTTYYILRRRQAHSGIQRKQCTR